MFGRDCFLNEIIWAYDYGGRPKNRWPAKHDTILVYVRDPDRHYFDQDAVDRIPYMAPSLVTAEKAARGKLPTDVWWHTIVPTNGKEKTGYPSQKPEGVLRRIVQASSAPGAWVLDFFAGSGTTGAVARQLDRRFVLIDDSPDALAVMQQRLGSTQVTYLDAINGDGPSHLSAEASPASANATMSPLKTGTLSEKSRRRPTLPGGHPPSTIGAGGLNCRVRNGYGCNSAAMATGNRALGISAGDRFRAVTSSVP